MAGLRLSIVFEWPARASHRDPVLAHVHPLLHRAIQPRFHGSGAGTLSLFPTPPAAIARNGSFAPTRSARTPAVVKLAAMPAGEASIAGHTRADVCPSRAHRASLLARGAPDTRDHLPYGRCSAASRRFSVELTRLPLISWTSSRARLGRWPLSRPPPAPGPLPTPLREERRVPLHPRCLPSMCFPIRDRALTHPRSGVGQLSTGCPQPVECCCRRLCVPCMILPALTAR
jgi:hypothetical protein